MATENFLPVLEAVRNAPEIFGKNYLTIVWDIGRVSDQPIGGVGIYEDKEVLFLHSSGNIYYIFDMHPEDMELFKREQNYYRAANGFLRDYAFGYDRRFEYNYDSKKLIFYKPSYDIGQFRVKMVTKIESKMIYNIYPHIPVGEMYRPYYSDALNLVVAAAADVPEVTDVVE